MNWREKNTNGEFLMLMIKTNLVILFNWRYLTIFPFLPELNFSMKLISIWCFVQLSSASQMATLRTERKIAAAKRNNHEENLRNNLSRDTKVSRRNENYITRASDEIEGRKTKKCLRTLVGQNGILGSLSERRFPSEITNSSAIRNRSGNFQELW